MAAIEAWLTSIFGIIFLIFFAQFIIMKIFPIVREFISLIVDDKHIVSHIMYLLTILIYILAFVRIVDLIKAINDQYLNYVSFLDSGISLILLILPYFKWLIIALTLFVIFKHINKFKNIFK